MNPRQLAYLFLSVFAFGCDSNTINSPTSTPPKKSQAPDIQRHKTSRQDESEMTSPNYEVADVYLGLRDQLFQLKPEEIGHTDAGESTVFAILMETGYPEAAVTLAGVADGTASLYISNGGGIIGAGEHEPVRKACTEFLTVAQDFVSKCEITHTFPLPKFGYVRCYLVTGGGVYTFEAPRDDLAYERHPCSPLFHKGHELLTAIREHTPQQ